MCPRISIVDDDASVRRALDRLFRSAGYLVDAYESAEAFVEAESIDETDCLILDVHLPGQSGLQLQADLRADKKRLPIIFISAYDDEQTRATAIESGAIEFLHKPLDSERLLNLIESALNDNLENGLAAESNEN